MSSNTFWKAILSFALMGLAVMYLIPLSDQPFEAFIKAESNQAPEFISLVDEADGLNQSGEYTTFLGALRALANQRQIDLAQFYPDLRLEQSLIQVNKRNQVLLEELMRRSKGSLKLGLDLAGGVSFTLEMGEHEVKTENGEELLDSQKEYMRQKDLAKAIEIIGERVNSLGLTEPVIRPVGDNRIEVQLPGVSATENPDVAGVLQKPARLEFAEVLRGRSASGPLDSSAPPGYVVKTLERQSPDGTVIPEYLFVKRIPAMTGEAVDHAASVLGQFGSREIIMRFTSKGSDQFADLTRSIADANRTSGETGRLAIILDGKLYSAPTVRTAITGGSASITGRFSDREAEELANVLNNPLDVPLEVVAMNEVGPTLAKDSIKSGQEAAAIGASLVVLFMVVYYMSAGIVAVIAVGVNLLFVLGALAMLGTTITLPGIAALVLTVGMAVDSNILIFERMREELRSGKSLPASLLGGFDKALSTIVDANVTTFITALILIFFGTGPVKGFGVTLAIGIAATMFCALIVTRFIMDILIHNKITKKMLRVSLLKDTSISFLSYRKVAFICSWVIVAIGIGTVFYKGDDIYGIDFVGGDEMVLNFDTAISQADAVKVASAEGLGTPLVTTQTPLGDASQVVLKVQTPHGEGQALAHALQNAYPEAGLKIIGENQIGPSVGKEIKMNALISVAIALACILTYIALRFEFGFGVGAVVATIHDVLMTIGIFVLCGRQFSAPMVAAVLMIVGYSINDTIVVFDRIREELELNPNMKLKNVVNLAINRTLTRTLLTSLTTFLATLALFIFGTGIVSDFALTFMVGIFTGTFSSIFIASPVFYWWHKGDRKHVEAHQDILPKYDWETGSKDA